MQKRLSLTGVRISTTDDLALIFLGKARTEATCFEFSYSNIQFIYRITEIPKQFPLFFVICICKVSNSHLKNVVHVSDGLHSGLSRFIG